MYLINDSLEFWPEQNRLISHHNKRVSYSLSGPAARCLVILLQRFPNVVTQDEFFEAVWKPEGMIVPQNTLYQNISLIRRGIKLVTGDNTQLVETVPKKGFRMRDGTSVQLLDDEEVRAETDDVDTVNVMSVDTESYSGTTKNSFNSKYRVLVFYLIAFPVISLALVILISSVELWPDTESEHALFNSYTIRFEKGGCRFLFSEESLDYEHPSSKFYLDMDCEKFPWVYVTRYSYIPTSSLIRCDKPLGGKKRPHCISVIFRE
jgi:DNA-binding winged helix-turn-helix (wHTH) protein